MLPWLLAMMSPLVWCADVNYKIEYDYANQGDDWYGKPGPRLAKDDFPQLTDIKTQQGDDFCYGFQPTLIAFNQGVELTRSQQSRFAYDYYFAGGSRCLFQTPEPPFDLIYADGFE